MMPIVSPGPPATKLSISISIQSGLSIVSGPKRKLWHCLVRLLHCSITPAREYSPKVVILSLSATSLFITKPLAPAHHKLASNDPYKPSAISASLVAESFTGKSR